MNDKDSTASGSQTRPEESASESQAEPEEARLQGLHLLHELLTQLGLNSVKTIKHKKYVKFDAVKTRKFLMTKLRRRDVYLLCIVGIQVGNRFDNKRLVLNQAGKIALRLLITTLRIKPKAENDNTLTLTRVMACFPEVTVALVSKTSVPMILPFEQLQVIHADFPMIARTQVAAAIVPWTLKIEEKRLALALLVVSSLLTSESIQAIQFNSKFKFTLDNDYDLLSSEINQKEKAEHAFQYVTKSFKSKVLHDEKRMEYALKFGVVDTNGALSPAWMAAGAASTVWLKDKYDYDISMSPAHFYESS